MASRIVDLDKMQREDHDALVRIEANLSNLSADVKLMGDGLNSRVANHELRLQAVETVVSQTNLLESYKEFKNLQQDVHDFRTTANVYRVIAGFIGGLIMFALTQLPKWWTDIFHK